MTGLAISPSKLFCNLSPAMLRYLFMMLCCSPRIAGVAASVASLPRLEFDGSMMKRHDDSQHSGR